MRSLACAELTPDFFVEMVSDAFKGKVRRTLDATDAQTQIARHRAVNGLLQNEFDSGLHALTLRLKTPEEIEREKARCCSA